MEFFEPMLFTDQNLLWENDWTDFIHVLHNQFRPIDPTADAEDNIINLRMKDNQHILKYNIEFTHLATQTSWDNSILCHCYYSGLAECIKDIMGQQGKPSTLDTLKTMALSIDACHWEQVHEKTCSGSDKTNNNNSGNNNKSDKKSGSNKPNNNNNSNNKNQSKGSSSNNTMNNKSKSASNLLTNKVGKDGKLTQQERQHHFDNKLCMFCGGAGHTANNCPKSSSSASKAKGQAASASNSSKKESDYSKK